MEQIEVRNTSKSYRIGENVIRAVDRVSLNVKHGEFVSIKGHSGSGKTTLLSMIGGILKNSEGEILFNGTDIYRIRQDELSSRALVGTTGFASTRSIYPYPS